MNRRALFQTVILIIAQIAFATILAYFIHTQFSTVINADFVSTGWLFGTFGTLYALITAFILVEVWNQYNALDSAVATEAKVLTSIWNYTDYLNDTKVSQSMYQALTSYLRTTAEKEVIAMGHNQTLAHPSPELSQILRVIDNVKFDDPRDASAFKALIQSFENLSSSRMSRISQGATRIPTLLKLFFNLVTFTFLSIYILQMFVSLPLYLLTVVIISTIVLFVRAIIFDLDNPFKGIWNLSIEPYNNALHFIDQSQHQK